MDHHLVWFVEACIYLFLILGILIHFQAILFLESMGNLKSRFYLASIFTSMIYIFCFGYLFVGFQ